jgi:hypothetical protein
VDVRTLEGIAEAILREGGQEDDEAPEIGALILRLLGEDGLSLERGGLGVDGLLDARPDGGWRIRLRSNLPAHRKRFVAAHELAEWWLQAREGYQGDDIEHAANYVGAAIIAPRRAFAAALRHHGRDFPALAASFVASQTTMALREAEILRVPRVIVAPSSVRVRGPEELVWPTAATLRSWARDGGPGLARTRLTDDPRRVVLDVEDVG